MIRIAQLLLCAVTVIAATSVACAEEGYRDGAKAAHEMFTRMCDDFGGRLTGTKNNDGALRRLREELRALGVESKTEPFQMPGWERGDDKVELRSPIRRELRATALYYTPAHRAFSAEVLDVNDGKDVSYPAGSKGKIALLGPGGVTAMRETVGVAAKQGVKALLFINREAGGQLLGRTGSFIGEALPIPVYSITQEEGYWIRRLLARGEKVEVRVETRSKLRRIETANLHVVFPGRSADRVLVGAHFDSWDLGQGAMDNGIGVMQLFALAHALRGRELNRTVELVWFNGEEQGLWGSRYAAERTGDIPYIAMINLDMVGVPLGVNALGDDTLVPALERWNISRAQKLPRGVENINWMGSDHTPYQLAGIRALTFHAPIPRESVRYYHDFADTIDKVSEQLIADSTVVIGDLVLALINDDKIGPFRRNREETEKMFTVLNLDRRMKALGFWPFE